MKLLFGIALAFAGAAPAYAVDWRLVGNKYEYPAIVAFVDHDSITRSGGFADFTMIYYVEGQSEATDVGVRQQRRAQCPGTGFQILSERRWLGPTEQPATTIDQTFKSATAGSIDLSAIEMICGTRVYNSEKIADPDKYAKDYFEDLAYEDDW
jgi:hypothetical protein